MTKMICIILYTKNVCSFYRIYFYIIYNHINFGNISLISNVIFY